MGGVALVLAFRHDADAMIAIAAAGGLEAALVMPFIAIVPGVVIAGIGGFAGAGLRRSLKVGHRHDY